jgi:hypothetical protein
MHFGDELRTPGALDLPAMSTAGDRLARRGLVKKRLLYIANALKQHVLGLEAVDDGVWSIYFCNVLLARVDERDYVIRA